MKRFAAVFPGQGAQSPGMGRGLHDAFPESRAVFEEAAAALGTPIAEVCFEGSAEQLSRTETTQPAILTVAIAAWRAIEARGLEPVAAAGHSLGEYAAHVAAGTLSFADAVRTVRARGRYMQEAVPLGEGAMAAILGLERQRVVAICDAAAQGRVVSCANYNSPEQVVVAGHADAVERAMAAAREAGALRVVRLPVSAPFHCALMRPAAERLLEDLRRLPFAQPRLPVYTNVDAEVVRDGAAARDALWRQVAAPVRWQELVERMVDDGGVETFVELGPGNVLAGLVKRIRRGVRVLGVADAAGVERAAVELGAA